IRSTTQLHEAPILAELLVLLRTQLTAEAIERGASPPALDVEGDERAQGTRGTCSPPAARIRLLLTTPTTPAAPAPLTATNLLIRPVLTTPATRQRDHRTVMSPRETGETALHSQRHASLRAEVEDDQRKAATQQGLRRPGCLQALLDLHHR